MVPFLAADIALEALVYIGVLRVSCFPSSLQVNHVEVPLHVPVVLERLSTLALRPWTASNAAPHSLMIVLSTCPFACVFLAWPLVRFVELSLTRRVWLPPEIDRTFGFGLPPGLVSNFGIGLPPGIGSTFDIGLPPGFVSSFCIGVPLGVCGPLSRSSELFSH